MGNDLSVINDLTRRKVRLLLPRLCLDPASRNYGGDVRENGYADSRNSVYEIQNLFAVYLYPDFPEYHGNPEVLTALRAHVAFLKRRQMPDGSMALGAGGLGGGNEVGFTLPGACATYARLERSAVLGRDELLGPLRDYIVRGAACIRRYWPYTSNHRWAACAGPLACAHELFPDSENVRVIEEYLSDGIDIDPQGLYHEERSPNYDTVANAGLVELADHYGRRDLLDLVRRNLEFTLAMRQPNGEAETLFSHRQDRGEAGRPSGAYYFFKRMAVELGRGDFATAADIALKQMEATPEYLGFIPLRYLFDDARLREEAIPRAPLPETVDLRCGAAPIRRWRRGRRASTLVADAGGHFWDATYGGWGAPARSDMFLDFHVGDAVIDGIKLRWGNGSGGFRPEAIEDLPDGSMRLVYVDPGAEHVSHYRPEGKKHRRRIEADHRAEVVVSRTPRGVRLAVTIGGWAEQPVNIQLLLREAGTLKAGDKAAQPLAAGGRTFTDGSAYELAGPDGSRIAIAGLPASGHALAFGDGGALGGAAERRCHRLVAGLFTPVHCDISLEEAGGPA